MSSKQVNRRGSVSGRRFARVPRAWLSWPGIPKSTSRPMSSPEDTSSADDSTSQHSQHEDASDSATSAKASSSASQSCNTSIASSSSLAKASGRLVRGDLVHPNVERSLAEDFGQRRSPKDSPTRWTDIFTSKRIRKKIHKHFREIHTVRDMNGSQSETTERHLL